MTALTILCMLGAATASGAFFTFSDFTIAGLKQLRPAHGAAAMQAINRAAPSPLFMLLLFGTGAACIALMVLASMRPDEPGSTQRIVAGAIYVAGVILPTVGYHVPRNNRLDRVDPERPEGQQYWAVYLREWVSVNHIRALAPFVSALMLAISLTAGPH